MRFSIEYLRETTEEHSVCSVRKVEARTLAGARKAAWRDVFVTRRAGATGFQIRNTRNVIVAIEEFDVEVESSTIH